MVGLVILHMLRKGGKYRVCIYMGEVVHYSLRFKIRLSHYQNNVIGSKWIDVALMAFFCAIHIHEDLTKYFG